MNIPLIPTIIVILVLFIVSYIWAYISCFMGSEKKCIEDCDSVGGEFVRYLPGERCAGKCICKIKGEIKNIW